MEWVIPALLVLIGLWVFATHGRLTRLRQEALAAWPDLDAALRRRHDLLTRLAQAVQKHAPKEKKLLSAMADSRAKATMADLAPEAASKAEKNLTAAIERVMALEQTYPELKADPTFLRIRGALAEREKDIEEARGRFNQAALAFNTAASRAPAILVAGCLNLYVIQYFGFSHEETEVVRAAHGSKLRASP